jgi:hypothetical protein
VDSPDLAMTSSSSPEPDTSRGSTTPTGSWPLPGRAG